MDDIKSMIEAGRNKAFIGKDEKVHGRGVILNIFELKTGKIGSRKVYGGKCIDGSLHKKMKLRVVRNGMIVASDITIANLKHFKEEKSEIKEGMECGIGIV